MRRKRRRPAVRRAVEFGLKSFGLSPERPICAALHRPRGDSLFGADMHLACELGVVIAGTMQRNHGAGWFRVGPGQAYACASFQPHQWRFPQGRFERIVFQFLPGLFQQMPTLQGFDPVAPFGTPARYGPIGSSRGCKRRLAALGRELAVAYRSHTSGPLSGPACLDLMGVLRLVSDEAPTSGHPVPGPHAKVFAASRINPALDLVRSHLDRRITLPEAAGACGMGRSTFVKLFKEVTGLGFAEFALRWRLTDAAHALRTTDWPIKAIARQFGFRYRTYFSRVFGVHYGVAPGQYRNLTD